MARLSGPASVQPAAFSWPPPIETFGNFGDVYFAFAAQADAAMRCSGNSRRKTAASTPAMDKRVVHNALAVLFSGTGVDHVVVRDPEPGQTAFALEVGKGGAQKQ